jgi:hypothetical protein
MSRTRTVCVDVEVDLSSFDDDDIEAEYVQRGLGGGDMHDRLREMFDAFHVGATDRAIALARQVAQDATGRVLA